MSYYKGFKVTWDRIFKETGGITLTKDGYFAFFKSHYDKAQNFKNARPYHLGRRYEDGSLYLCNFSELAHRVTFFDANRNQHRVGGPSDKFVGQGGNGFYLEFTVDGYHHRLDGPAFSCDSMRAENYRLYRKLHGYDITPILGNDLTRVISEDEVDLYINQLIMMDADDEDYYRDGQLPSLEIEWFNDELISILFGDNDENCD